MPQQLYIAENLQYQVLDSDYYGSDVEYDGVAYRAADAQWLTWLRDFHSGSRGDAASLAAALQEYHPELVGVEVYVPHYYKPPRDPCPWIE